MPAFFWRWNCGAHGLKNLKRNLLSFCGTGPVRETLIGMVEAVDGGKQRGWLDKMIEPGRRGV